MNNNFLTGDTIKATWINSLNSPSALIFRCYDSNETLVESASMTDSGDGYHYYHNHTVPDTPGFYVADMLATIGGKPYKKRIKYRAITDEA